MDDTFKKALVDYFTSVELVDLLDTPIEDLIELLEEDIKDNEEIIKDAMNYTDPQINPEENESEEVE